MPAVPVLVGLSRDNAVTALTAAGLVVGIETNVISANPRSVTRSIPIAGTVLAAGASVDIDISVGLRPSRWWENPSSFIFAALGILTLIALLSVIVGSPFTSGGLLKQLAEFDLARGLIAFLIAFTTVGIAIILVVSTVVLNDSPENDKRFDRGKQVLSILIGVLGTIVGFYFAGANKTVDAAPAITIKSLPSATVGKPYPQTVLNESGGTPPFKWTVKPKLPDGMDLSEQGVLSGTPKAPSSDTSFTFTVVDASAKSDMKKLDFTVEAPANSGTTGTGTSPLPK